MTLARTRLALLLLAATTLQFFPAAAIPRAKGAEAPIYNPDTRSYFELRHHTKPIGWAVAQVLAVNSEYKGVRGRLAIVESAETHAFLYRNFVTAGDTWIGLRYWCTFRKLTWADGHVHERAEFSAWARSWHRPSYKPCGSAGTAQTGYMSVYYLPTDRGFKWQAVGSAKGFRRYFVEYPTGAP